MPQVAARLPGEPESGTGDPDPAPEGRPPAVPSVGPAGRDPERAVGNSVGAGGEEMRVGVIAKDSFPFFWAMLTGSLIPLPKIPQRSLSQLVAPKTTLVTIGFVGEIRPDGSDIYSPRRNHFC